MPNSHADQIMAAEVMLSGLKGNSDQLLKCGIDKDFLTKFETTYQNALTNSNQQQALKSRLKEKTVAVKESATELNKLRSKARNLVKMEFPQESWKEFGIKATR